MTCAACGGEVYQFHPGPGVRATAAGLPQICRRCGELRVDGHVVVMPTGFNDKMASMAEEASRTAAEETRNLTAETTLTGDARIGAYFERVYKAGYINGFFRAVAYWTSIIKEGRVNRLRQLWRSFKKDASGGSSAFVVTMDGDLYTEFDRLLELGAQAPESAHGQSPSH